jgi:TnpA family transposase
LASNAVHSPKIRKATSADAPASSQGSGPSAAASGQAIAVVADGTLHARDPRIGGDSTTACASDSKHFGAWDQNLTTQWHVRYGGRGVIIYWHVDKNSLCIHSQLKSPVT